MPSLLLFLALSKQLILCKTQSFVGCRGGRSQLSQHYRGPNWCSFRQP
ncbi:unnamed protein product [Musa textilis]